MPSVSQVHVDAALTNISLAYRNPGFIAPLLAPAVAVRRQSNRYFIHDPAREGARPGDDRRAPGAAAAEVDFALSQGAYYCDGHALQSAIPDEERANADLPLDVEIARVEFLTDKIELNREIQLAGLLADSADLPGTTLSGDDQWSDPDSDPLAAVEAGRAAILAASGAAPDTLVLPAEVYAAVRHHPRVIERIQYVHLGVATPAVLADLFDVDRVLVPRALKNTARDGAEPDMAAVWGKHAWLCHVAPRPALRCLSLALAFHWSEAPGAVAGCLVELWRDDNRKADVVRVQRYYDQRLVAPLAGYRWKNAVA